MRAVNIELFVFAESQNLAESGDLHDVMISLPQLRIFHVLMHRYTTTVTHLFLGRWVSLP
jgi:hypothetical protein